MHEINRQTGAQALIGYVVRIEDGEARAVLDVDARHRNRNDGLHGGVIATLLDAAGGYAASLRDDGETLTPVTTVSMTVHYLDRIRDGRVTAQGRVTGGGQSIIFVDSQLTHQDGTVIATATGIYKVLKRPA